MRAGIQERLTIWLGLVAALLLGAAPARGLVLCIEPDGRVAFEFAMTGADCGPGPQRSESPVAGAPEQECCPCVDIAIFAAGDDSRASSRSVQVRLSAPSATVARISAEPPGGVRAPGGGLRVEPPRPAQVLAWIRSVVLHV